ncbi:MAG TPA: lyase family protein [Galbitalea sp.]|jgi:3-carboxy-cis,cis-muconate cycloisomerase|nr:lyase family protein [Galbitalea sp.]
MTDLLDPLGNAGDADDVLSDAAWVRAMALFESRLVDALTMEGLIPDGVDGVTNAVAGQEDFDAAVIATAARAGGNPVIPLVAAMGAAMDDHARHGSYPEAPSDYLHLGATSQDVMDSAAMVIARVAIIEMSKSLGALIATLARLAELHRASPMAGRTLGQHASPVTFGVVVAGWLDGILAARNNLESVRGHLPLQYGGSVGTRAVLYELVRQRRPDANPNEVIDAVLRVLAERLGLRVTIPWHSNRMPIVVLGSALAALVGAIGAMAADINVLSRTEIAEVSERLGKGEGGSSAMPHKRNPVTSVLLVSAARRSPGLVATLFAAQVTEDQRSTGAWHSEWRALRELERLALQTSATAADLAERLEIDTARMRSNLDFTDGLIYSERVTAILAESLGKSVAFELVGEASRESVQTSRPLQVVLAARLAGNHDDALRSRVVAAFDPDYGTQSSGAIIDAVLARAKEQS